MNFHTYHFEARFGSQLVAFPTERQARQWVADQLGTDPSEERYGIWQVSERRSSRELVWLSPELRFGIAEGLDEITEADACQVCGAEAIALDQELGPICEDCIDHLAHADAFLRSLPLNPQLSALN